MKNIISYNNVQDYLLVADVRNGNEQAFTEIYVRYFNRIKNKLCRENLINTQDAEDIVTESFLDFYESVISGEYKDENKLFYFVFKIAYRRFLKKIKHQKYLYKEEYVIDNLLKQIYSDNNEKEVYFNAAEKSIKLLSEICKELILLKYLNKYTDKQFYSEHKELKTVQNVRRKRKRCMDKLREKAQELIKNN